MTTYHNPNQSTGHRGRRACLGPRRTENKMDEEYGQVNKWILINIHGAH